MSKDETKDLFTFLKPWSSDIKELVLWLREFAWDQYPKANELIYDNYNALAFGWSLTDKLGSTFCSIAVFRTNNNIHFGFYRGNEISDPKKLLLGNGNQYRYILVKNKKDFPKTYIKKLVNEAYVNALSKLKDKKQIVEGTTITESISAAKRTLKKDATTKKR